MKGARALVAVWRLALALTQLLGGWLTITFLFPSWPQQRRDARVQAWARTTLRRLGIGLEVQGEPPSHGPVLLVSNHISWLDILVIHAGGHCRFVAKSDLRRWPVIGTLAAGSGTLFIERESRRDALRVVHRMADSLRGHEVLAVFPEGTTSDGRALLPFHANLLQAAISADAPVQPIGLSFIDTLARQPSLTPCYIGDDTLAASVWRTLAGPPITALARYGVPQTAQGRDRRQWAADLRSSVEALRQG